jgi:hypothetical protein
MVRAVKGTQTMTQQAATDQRVTVLDCGDYTTLHTDVCNGKRFFDG